MATSAAVPSARQSRPGLKRDIGFVGLIWASEGSIIGSGWLFGAQGALSTAGPAAIISWVIGGTAILILALVHAELGGMYPVSGGTARFPHYAFGGAAGASFGWFSWLQAATVAPIEVLAMITYGQHYSFASGWLKTKNGQHILTASGIVVAVLLMAAVTAINFLSIRLLARTNSVATWWKVGIPLLTIFALAVVQFHGSNFTAADGFNPYGAKGILSAVSTSGIIFALLGFEQADQLAGESSNPRRDIPRAVIGSIVIGAVIYILLQIVFIAALPKDQIQGMWAHAAYTTMTGPFAQVATLLSMGWLATILYIDAVVSPGGTGLIYITGSSRVSYGLSRNGYVPSVFERTNRRGVPWVGLITAFIIGCICFLPFPSWRSLVGLITSASVLMYAGAPLSLGVFRRRLPTAHRPYRLPGATWLSPLAFVVANLLILWSGWMTDWKLGVAILLGYVILIANRVFKLNPIMPQLDLRAAQWLPAYLVGMGLIVYLSDFGPLKHPWFPLWWDMLVTAVFSLVIYFWALAVALPAEQIQRMVDQVVLPEEANLG
ncbi:APC family permease [Kribbella jiaozuonensis]|uniref:APC family permease n=1 Tax=Kribbella jiaozuonensis TaxID=2575441 RepID=A0A4V5UW18_9ACTN|nr:APC family permease [Kribbella jiaozuonensis]TKK73683.1 APC family permease [Kribbella jiaozuonensis]